VVNLDPHEDLCKLKGESPEEIALDSQTVRSTVKLGEDSEVERSSEASEAVTTLAPGRVQSSCDVFGSFHKPVKRRRSFVSGTEDSCDHYSKESKRLQLTDSIVPATRSNAPDISISAGTTATEVLTLNFKPEP
jgi:hypothetical protein